MSKVQGIVLIFLFVGAAFAAYTAAWKARSASLRVTGLYILAAFFGLPGLWMTGEYGYLVLSTFRESAPQFIDFLLLLIPLSMILALSCVAIHFVKEALKMGDKLAPFLLRFPRFNKLKF